jgi:hypothetical protein
VLQRQGTIEQKRLLAWRVTMTVNAASTSTPRLNNVGIWIGYGLGALALPGCFVIAARMGAEIWLNMLICIFGSIVGWSAGMLFSPKPGEQPQFSEYRKAISAFISGFVLAKLDLLFAASNTPPNSTLVLGRMLLFATTCLLCLQFTYVARSYLSISKADSA